MAKVSHFSSKFGMSLEIKDVWYKFESAITIEVDEGDNLEEVKKKAHNTVQVEVENQLQAVVDSLNGNQS
jgi:hypothetical protein